MKRTLFLILVLSLIISSSQASFFEKLKVNEVTVPVAFAIYPEKSVDINGDGLNDNLVVGLWRYERWGPWIPVMKLSVKEDSDAKNILDTAFKGGLIGNWEEYSWDIGKASKTEGVSYVWVEVVDHLADADGDGILDQVDLDGNGIPDKNTLANYKLNDMKDYYLVLLNPNKLGGR